MFSWRNKKNINTFGLKKSALALGPNYKRLLVSSPLKIYIGHNRPDRNPVGPTTDLSRLLTGLWFIICKHDFTLQNLNCAVRIVRNQILLCRVYTQEGIHFQGK